MVTLTVQLDAPTPIVDQIVAGLRRLIASGEIEPGHILPPVRQLAADLGVNLNTVARAYRSLEATGLVTTVRGRGTQVVATTERPLPVEATDRVRSRLADAVADAKLAGLSEESLRGLLTELLSTYYARQVS